MSKAVNIAGVLVLVVICIVVTAGFVIRSGKKGNPSPESINMGSAGSMGPMPPAAHTSEQPESKETKSPANTVSVDDLGLAPSDAPVKSFAITAEVVKKAARSELWTYNGTVPGPEIRVTEGDHVHVTLINHLPVPTSTHWHGIAVPNRSDGVAGLTQNAVKPGQSYTYDFIATEPGTYLVPQPYRHV